MKKIPLFYKLFIPVIASLAALILIGLGAFWVWLDLFEKSTPQYLAQSFCMALANKEYGKVEEYTKGLLNAFEGDKELERYFSESLGEKDLKVMKNKMSYSATEPAFVILADDKPVMNIVLSQTENGSWAVSSLDALQHRNSKVSIYMPAGSTLKINGIEVTEDNATMDEGTLEELAGVPEEIAKPSLIKVDTGRFLYEPVITASVGGDEASVHQMRSGEYFVSPEKSETLDSKYETMVFDVSKLYSNYISDDKKFKDLAAYLVEDSTLYNRLRTMEVYFYTPHTSFQFKNMTSDRYIKFSDDCFSCHVSFTYVLYRGARAYEYPTNYTFFFIRQNGKFKLAELYLE